ncbi:MAG: serine/threonine protein kinase, partial [Calditrichaeota bacterium]|nr:serine/threonine protein kinase [Calditrichota bacterium]
GPLAPAAALDIARQIAEGLQAAHEKGIIHRDIKSANIMLDAKERVKVMDFGLAKVHGGAQVTRDGSTLGTAAYMSPEQATGGEVDLRTDIWSYGVVLYEMLNGALPFRGEYAQAVIFAILNEAPPELPDDGSPERALLRRVIEKCLSKAPEG